MAAAAAAYVSLVPPLLGRIDAELKEIRVCTNRTCRRQGSIQTLHTLSGLAQPEVTVSSCGCLGRCGAGPNVVALPDGVIIGHCGTATRACQVMVELSGGRTGSVVDANKSLEALALRKRAESEIEKRNFSKLKSCFLRSLARLAMGNYSGALEDVREALKLASNYTEVRLPILNVGDNCCTLDATLLQAYICQGDIFLAMDQYDAAEKSYAVCPEIDPSIRRSKSFKSRIVKLQEKLTAANIP
ncbi:hypothetical protein Ddye_014686 [Dipteronia dyeriana]|uniref:Uncharacterized protein n=1 Tax=Dipteronia dyeriana TaxID=168575 RepID=A0AAD9X8Q6_9ROSI|nr:hypothetical protein Ddye_014686 [Dipteronia dyeriana]